MKTTPVKTTTAPGEPRAGEPGRPGPRTRCRGGWSAARRGGGDGAGCSRLAAFVLVVVAGAGWALRLAEPPGDRTEDHATVLETRVGDVTVLTDDEGYTLYWFGPDNATMSACEGGCARNWPPVTAPAVWGPGVTGTLGAIARPGGSLQATYDGHPLYTTTADTGPGQAKGNDVWSDGGQWHEVVVSGPRRADAAAGGRGTRPRSVLRGSGRPARHLP